MITQELLEYIRTEISKGKTREEIHKVLISGGGWTEDDLSEAFKIVIPMQNVVAPVPAPKPQIQEEKPVAPTPAFKPAPVLNPIINPKPISTVPPQITPAGAQNPTQISPSLSKPVSYSVSFVPPQPSYSPKTISPVKAPSHFLSSFLKFFVILLILSSLGFGVWTYRSQFTNIPDMAVNLWTSLVNKMKGISLPSFNAPQPAPVENVVVNPVVEKTDNTVVNCGNSATPKLDNPASYENNPVLSCLGTNALNCKNATGTLKDDLFPTIFEIVKTQDSCNFKLSYPTDSPLVDITGKKLTSQYIMCPISIVKGTDNTDSANPKFIAPDKTNSSKYASQIYFYGTLGLFVENNLDQKKIEALGCNGEYIQSVIASYNKIKTKK